MQWENLEMPLEFTGDGESISLFSIKEISI
jgi:hypothetical protein